MKDVDRFLSLDLPFFEPVNRRRGGWSGVSKIVCANKTYFIKRQINHAYREPRRGFLRTPTLRREYRNIRRLQRAGVNTAEIVCYGEEGANGFLITRELKGFINLETFLIEHPRLGRSNGMKVVSNMLLRMHAANLHHGCLYGKHVMIKPGVQPAVALLDLEKLRMTIRTRHSAAKDISQLIRHTSGLVAQDQQTIVDCYASRFPNFEQTLDGHLANLDKYSVHRRLDGVDERA